MKRQRRNRSTRRRGLQSIGDILNTVLTDLDHLESRDRETESSREKPTATLTVGVPVNQETFAFYQPTEA